MSNLHFPISVVGVFGDSDVPVCPVLVFCPHRSDSKEGERRKLAQLMRAYTVQHAARTGGVGAQAWMLDLQVGVLKVEVCLSDSQAHRRGRCSRGVVCATYIASVQHGCRLRIKPTQQALDSGCSLCSRCVPLTAGISL